jgi:hypothetical protein
LVDVASDAGEEDARSWDTQRVDPLQLGNVHDLPRVSPTGFEPYFGN